MSQATEDGSGTPQRRNTAASESYPSGPPDRELREQLYAFFLNGGANVDLYTNTVMEIIAKDRTALLQRVRDSLPDTQPSEAFYQERGNRETIARRYGFNDALTQVQAVLDNIIGGKK